MILMEASFQEQALNSELAGTLASPTMELRAITNGIAECEERRAETTDMMLFNNGYGVTIITYK